MSELLDKIRSRGYWRVVIRPGSFIGQRVPNISTLYPLLQKISVQLRRWNFPHLDTRAQPDIESDWIGQGDEWDRHLELWRFYQSGQFVDFAGITDDWRNQSKVWPAPADWKHGALLEIGDALFTFTEIFEFAARLALTEAGSEQMHIEVGVAGLQNRELWVDDVHWWPPFPSGRKASLKELPYKVDLSRTQLITEPRDLALKPTIELFRHFGWEPSLGLLRDMQQGLLDHGSLVGGSRQKNRA